MNVAAKAKVVAAVAAATWVLLLGGPAVVAGVAVAEAADTDITCVCVCKCVD